MTLSEEFVVGGVKTESNEVTFFDLARNLYHTMPERKFMKSKNGLELRINRQSNILKILENILTAMHLLILY